MNTTNKNEIDLLLQALGRKASSPAATAAQSPQKPASHLDADELNCYAEGVVSDLERARYVKHLADCDSCRRIVAGLAPAAAFSNRHAATEKRSSRTWRDSLAALFAPSVLRYAVPALALTTIMAIAIVVLRRPSRPEFVAQNQPQTLPVAPGGGENQKSATTGAPQLSESPEKPQPASAETKGKSLSRPQDSDVIQPATKAPSAAASTDQSPKGSVQPGTSGGVAQAQPTFATEPSDAVAPPPPQPALADATKTAEARKEEVDTESQKRRREDSYSSGRVENEVMRSGPAKGGPSRNNSQNVAGISSAMSRPADKDDKGAGSTVGTRRVSGRLFHREGNAWIDSDYAAGRALINVRRGSEQFRALTADEPALGSIAEQLGGEIIVVWKGAAYRIR